MAMKIIQMSVTDFAKVPDNPRQRDTVRHAAKALRSHLKFPSATHEVVAVACINGVPVCKLDGHTRSYLWATGDLEVSNDVLTVQVYEVASMDEACELYTHFDNASAVEGSVDKLSGACRESGLALMSPLLSDCKWNTALKCAHNLRFKGCSSEYVVVPLWAPAIAEVDSWDLPKNKFKGSGLISLMFIIAGSPDVQPDIAKEFFTRYQKGEGIKTGTRRDGVQALDEHMMDRRVKNLMSGYENIFDMICKGYSCFRAWTKNEMIASVKGSREQMTAFHAKTKNHLETILNKKGAK